MGSVETSIAERRRLAIASHAFNRKTPIFCELFPQLLEESPEAAPGSEAEAAEAEAAAAAAPAERGGFSLLYVGMAALLAAAVGIGYFGREI